MAVIGNIIKGVINLTNLVLPEINHVANQKEVLFYLLDKAKSAEFGEHF